MGNECVFCRIAEGSIPSHTVYEDDYFKAILDIAPACFGHTVIVAKTHAENIFELPEEFCAGLLPFAKKVSGAVMRETGASGVNILQNNGVDAGQTVFHFHVHIVPRFKDDPVVIKWSPVTNKPESGEMSALAERIAGRL